MMSYLSLIQRVLLHGGYGDSLAWTIENPKRTKVDLNNPPLELVTWQSDNFDRYRPHTFTIRKGEYSDDTQLTLATLRSLCTPNFLERFILVELPTWLLYERGGGTCCKRMAKHYTKASATTLPYINSQGVDLEEYSNNGAIMRIMPHLFEPYLSLEDRTCKALDNTLSTHGHYSAYIATKLFMVYANQLLEERPFDLYEIEEFLRLDFTRYDSYFEKNTLSISKYEELLQSTLNYLDSLMSANTYEEKLNLLQTLKLETGLKGYALNCMLGVITICEMLNYSTQSIIEFIMLHFQHCDTDTMLGLCLQMCALNRDTHLTNEQLLEVENSEVICYFSALLSNGEKFTLNPAKKLKCRDTSKLKNIIFQKLKDKDYEIDLGDFGQFVFGGAERLETHIDSMATFHLLYKHKITGERIHITKYVS